MSMISGLIDELNKSADEWNASNMFELARMCRDAADTITELRGALQVASVDYRHLSEENAKLRELVKALLTCATDGDCDECRLNGATPWHVGKAQLCDGVWDRVSELGVEVDG